MATQIISKVVDIRLRDLVTQRDAGNPGLVLNDNARAVSVNCMYPRRCSYFYASPSTEDNVS